MHLQHVTNVQLKKTRTKAGYWSCNLPRYASQLGLGANHEYFLVE